MLERLLHVGLRRSRRSARRSAAGRVALRPEGSPMSAVKSPMMSTTVWPRSWNWRSLRSGTAWPRCRSGRGGVDAELDAQRRAASRACVARSASGTMAAVPLSMTCSCSCGRRTQRRPPVRTGALAVTRSRRRAPAHCARPRGSQRHTSTRRRAAPAPLRTARRGRSPPTYDSGVATRPATHGTAATTASSADAPRPRPRRSAQAAPGARGSSTPDRRGSRDRRRPAARAQAARPPPPSAARARQPQARKPRRRRPQR